MGVLIRWEKPDSEANWDQVEIHRSDDDGSTYAKKQTQSIDDNTWYDEAGDSTNLYKIRFKVSSTGTVSGFSEPFQATEVSAYASVKDFRRLTGIDASELDDTEVINLVEDYAIAEVNRDIQSYIDEEEIEYISNEKENDIDGSNKTFFVKEPLIGDLNDDGVIDSNDLDVWAIDADGNRTDFTVDSVDDVRRGKFTLASAPTENQTGDGLFVRYASTPLDADTPHPLLKVATALVAGKYAFVNMNASDPTSIRVGNVSMRQQSDGFERMEDVYHRIRYQINSGQLTGNVDMDNLRESIFDRAEELSRTGNVSH